MKKVPEVQADEIRLFYLWLCGRLNECRQRENLAIVYIVCPEMRDELLKEFLTEFNAQHRYLPLRRVLFGNRMTAQNIN